MNTKTPHSDRRDFLKRTLLAAASLGLPQIVPCSVLGAEGTAPSNRITMASIGTGDRGRYLLRSFLGAPGTQVVAVCDPFADRRAQAKRMVDEKNGNQDCAAVPDFREIIARPDVDALIVAPQDHWHACIAVAAARAGKHMYCEKPLGVSYAESRAIRDVVRRTKITFQTGTQQRSERNFRHACELVRNGYVGNVHTVQVAAEGPHFKPAYKGTLDPQPVPPGLNWELFTGPAPARPYNPGRHAWPDWYLIYDYCTGFIVNWGVHHLDIALWGMPVLAEQTFELECKADYRKEGFTDNVNGWHATFTYPGGLKMVYSDNFKQKIGIRFAGDKGWVHVDRAGIWAEPASLLDLKMQGNDSRLHRSDHHALDFLQAVRARRDPVSNVDAGHKASYFGMIADISARLGRTLTWDPRREEFAGAQSDAAKMLTRPMRGPWKLA